MLYREIIAVLSLSHKNEKKVYYDINEKFLNVKFIGVYADGKIEGLVLTFFATELSDSGLRDKATCLILGSSMRHGQSQLQTFLFFFSSIHNVGVLSKIK